MLSKTLEWLNLEIEPWSAGPLANTLLIRPIIISNTDIFERTYSSEHSCHHHCHHHHHLAPPALISLTLFHRPSLSSIAPGRSSRLHPVSPQSWCIYVLADRLAFARPCEAVHWSMSLMSSLPLLLQCSSCLVRLTCLVSWWMEGGRTAAVLWVSACRICSIQLEAFLWNCRQAFSPYVSVHVVHP